MRTSHRGIRRHLATWATVALLAVTSLLATAGAVLADGAGPIFPK
jgi:hypothetical protein